MSIVIIKCAPDRDLYLRVIVKLHARTATSGQDLRVLAGPIVITGWKFPSSGSEVRDLTGMQMARIRYNRRTVLDVIAGRPVADAIVVEDVREMLDYVANAP